MNAADLAEKLGGRKNGADNSYSARCPAHADEHPSLSIADSNDGKLLVRCHAGCSQEAVIAGLRALGLWPGKPGEESPGIPRRTTATVQHFTSRSDDGLTLEQYAALKQLPVAWLRELGASDFTKNKVPVVRFSFMDESGSEIAARFRGSGANKFRWKSGDPPVLYGLWLLEQARTAGYIVVPEGESDAQTLWYQGIPAAAVPGATSWREDWVRHFEGIATIYVVIEPDRGGEAMQAWVRKSSIRHRVRLVRLEGAKDPSELYLSDPDHFIERWQAAIDASVPWLDVEADEARARSEEAWSRCSDLARTPDILAAFERAIAAAGVAAEGRAVKLLYLVVTSRLVERPVSAVVKGPSSAGKSFTTGKVLSFFPPGASYALSAMSERALAYSEEPLVHRVLVIYEAAGLAGEFASYLMRSLLSEGRVRYETVEKTHEGLRPRLIEREGPTGLIVTTTAVHLHPENETRLLSIPVNDTQEQTRAILISLADEGIRPQVPREPWHALQEWIAGGPCRVVIPYAKALAIAIPPVATRLRRDFATVLSLICAHALLHRATREVDQAGNIVATHADYAAVRELVVDLVADSAGSTVAPTIRETVAMVAAELDSGRTEVSLPRLATRLQLDKSTASRRVKAAVAAGYLANLEDRKGRPARLVLGEPMPDDIPILPPADGLYVAKCCTVAPTTEGIAAAPSPLPEHGIMHRTKAEEEAWWTQVFADRGIADPAAAGDGGKQLEEDTLKAA